MIKNLAINLVEITEKDIESLREMDDLDAADIYDARIRVLDAQTRRTFVEIGLICLEMSERSLWARLTSPATGVYYHSFDAWMLAAAGVSRSSAYSSMKMLKELRDVSIADLREMPRCNAVTLSQLSTAVKQEPEVIQAAKDLSEDEFIAKIHAAHPDQHLERRRKIIAAPTESARSMMDRAIGLCMQIEGCTRDQALELICQEYWEEHQGEGYGAVASRGGMVQ